MESWPNGTAATQKKEFKFSIKMGSGKHIT